jgi:hypothetical protein
VVFLTPEGGARLAQVGGAKVLPGVTFTAKTVLDVCVYLEVNRIQVTIFRPTRESDNISLLFEGQPYA